MPFRVVVSRLSPFTCLFVVTSTFAFRGEDTKTRQTKGDNTKFSTKKFSFLRLLNEVISPSIFRVFVSSPRKAEGEITTKIHVFVSSPFGTKRRQHEMA